MSSFFLSKSLSCSWFIRKRLTILVMDFSSFLSFSLHLLSRNWRKWPFACPFFKVSLMSFSGIIIGSLLLLILFFELRRWILSLQSREGHVLMDLREFFLVGWREIFADGTADSGFAVGLTCLWGLFICLLAMMGECFTKRVSLLLQGDRRGP